MPRLKGFMRTEMCSGCLLNHIYQNSVQQSDTAETFQSVFSQKRKTRNRFYADVCEAVKRQTSDSCSVDLRVRLCVLLPIETSHLQHQLSESKVSKLILEKSARSFELFKSPLICTFDTSTAVQLLLEYFCVCRCSKESDVRNKEAAD